MKRNTHTASVPEPIEEDEVDLDSYLHPKHWDFFDSFVNFQDEVVSTKQQCAGDVYSFSVDSMLVAPKKLTPDFRAQQLLFDGEVTSITCGDEHFLALTSSGHVFAWGSNRDGQLGIGEHMPSSEVPQLVKFEDDVRIKQIACSKQHSIALSTDGRVYTWGGGMFGVLGQGDDVDYCHPTLVCFPDPHHASTRVTATTHRSSLSRPNCGKAIAIACSQFNSAAVVEDNQGATYIFVWGAGDSGQIGNGKLSPHLSPCLVNMSGFGSELVRSVSLGNRHAVAVTAKGLVYCWGDNQFGQLGYRYEQTIIPTPTLVPLLAENLTQIQFATCGERHVSAIDTKGNVWSWGSGETHQIGVFDNVDQFQPVKVEFKAKDASERVRITSVDVGTAVSLATTETGQLWIWGWAAETPIPKFLDKNAGNFFQSVCVGSNECSAVLSGDVQRIFKWTFDVDGDNIVDNFPVLYKDLRGKWISDISVAPDRFAAVCGDGRLFVWGKLFSSRVCGL